MKRETPPWAVKTAGPEDEVSVRAAQKRGTLLIKWPDPKALRGWARRRDWPTPWFGFKAAFLTKMLESKASFELAVNESGMGEAQGARCTV
jgi:hypothetical protein